MQTYGVSRVDEAWRWSLRFELCTLYGIQNQKEKTLLLWTDDGSVH